MAIATAVTVIRLPREVGLNRDMARLAPEAVAHPAHGEEKLGVFRVLLQLLAQVADVDVYGARIAVLGIAPDVLEQRLAAEHAAGRARQRGEDLELDVGDADLLRAQGDHAPLEVDLQLAAVEGLLVGRLRDHPRAPQGGLDAAAELAHREGLGYVVVGADLEAGDLVGLAALGGQHDDRHLAARAHLAADFDAVHLRQHQVEDDEIEAGLLEAP